MIEKEREMMIEYEIQAEVTNTLTGEVRRFTDMDHLIGHVGDALDVDPDEDTQLVEHLELMLFGPLGETCRAQHLLITGTVMDVSPEYLEPWV